MMEVKNKDSKPVIGNMEIMGHEQVVFCTDTSTGLKAIIAIHDTTLGPALGGTRMWNYSNESDALQDVLRLSRGMTFKAAISGLNLGGGKAVIIGDATTEKTEALMKKFGEYVDVLGGKYITAEDVGTTEQDMEIVRKKTRHVTGVSKKNPGVFQARADNNKVVIFSCNDSSLIGKFVNIEMVEAKTKSLRGLIAA